jgi:glucokinase
MGEKRVIGIDLGGTNIKVAAVDESGKIVVKEERPTEAPRGAAFVLDRIADMARTVAQRAGWSWNDVTGIGAGIPGFLDFEKGMIEESPNLGWKKISVVEELNRRLKAPVVVENDANVAALGEAWIGAGRGHRHILAITIGTGIGGGLIIDGMIYHGANGMGGEIGHIVIDPQGDRCNCGNRGCLETITSATAVVRHAKRRLEAGEESSLQEVATLTARDVFDHARQGDAVACSVVGHMTETLGYALSLAANILNPELIVIGGGVSKAGDILFKPLYDSFSEHALARVCDAVAFRPAELGNDAGVLGAARLSMIVSS